MLGDLGLLVADVVRKIPHRRESIAAHGASVLLLEGVGGRPTVVFKVAESAPLCLLSVGLQTNIEIS